MAAECLDSLYASRYFANPALAPYAGQAEQYCREAARLVGADYLYLALFTLGVAIYVIIIWHFYKHIARRDLFKVDFSKYTPETRWRRLKMLMAFLLYCLRYGVLFPLFSFLWFALVSLMLFVLSKTQPFQSVMFSTITMLAAVRIIAYYKEEAAQELSKILPLVLLAFLLIDPAGLGAELFAKDWNAVWDVPFAALRYLGFVVVLEYALRTLYQLKLLVFRRLRLPGKAGKG